MVETGHKYINPQHSSAEKTETLQYNLLKNKEIVFLKKVERKGKNRGF